MVAGGIPDEVILRHLEFVGGPDCSGPLISGQPEHFYHLVIIPAKWVGKGLQRSAGQLLQPALILNDFIHSQGRSHRIQRGMVQAVTADLMGAVDILYFLRRDLGDIQVLFPRNVNYFLMTQQSGA